MTEAVGNLRANLTADWADFRAELQRSAGALGNFGKSFSQAAGGIARNAAGMFASFQVGKFVSDSIQASIAAQELEGAFRAAFGESADAANTWVEGLSSSLGRSETALRTAALEFQNLFGEVIPTNEAATEASERFTQLSLDFAALKNIPIADSFRLIQQGLSGSGRGLRAYGVDLSEAAVRQEALRTGVITANQELSNEQATLVRASILTRELGDATGAAAEQLGGAAAEQDRLRARFEETSRSLGDSLLPAFSALQGALASALEGFNSLFRGIGEGLAKNDAFVIGLTQITQLLRGTPRSYDEVAAAVARVRAQQAAGTTQNETTRNEIRGLSTETSGYADTLTNLAGTLANGGSRGTQRSWAEQHAADIERLREVADPAGAAIRQFAEQMAIARRAGIDMGEGAVRMASDMIEAAGGIEVFKGSLDDLPEQFRSAIERMRVDEAREQLQQYRDDLKDFGAELTAEFAPESGVEERVRRINEAFQEGIISAQVYKDAIAEATGETDREAKIAEAMQEQADERERAWGKLRDTIADVATGTRDASDAVKQFVLEWIRAQWIEPFLNRLFSNKGTFGGGSGGGFGFDLGAVVGSIFGGHRANGGPVVPGMAYEVGERGRELFVPDTPGQIVPHGQYSGNNVTMNIYTPDANSFRASRRQLAQQQRRAQGVE